MAEALFRARLGADEADWQVGSAGTWALEGDQISGRARQVLKARGIDPGDHQARPVSRELLSQYNLILVMAHNHLEALRAEFPDLVGRIYLFNEMAGRYHDIRDPFGGSLADYRETADELDRVIATGFEKIVQLASGPASS
jgi:protein-tyrosine phosphatase